MTPKPPQTGTFQAQVVAEQRKEIARLQKLLAKLEVKKDSEIAALKAKLAAEKKSKIKVVLNRFDADL
jgi:hypothetical protein